MIDESELGAVADPRSTPPRNGYLPEPPGGPSAAAGDPFHLVGAGSEAIGEADTPPRRCRRVPTVVLIAVPMIVFVAVMFLSAALMPKHTRTQTSPPSAPSNATAPRAQEARATKPLDDALAPALVPARDHGGSGLPNVRDHPLYMQLKRAVFHKAESDAGAISPVESWPNARLNADKNQIRSVDGRGGSQYFRSVLHLSERGRPSDWSSQVL